MYLSKLWFAEVVNIIQEKGCETIPLDGALDHLETIVVFKTKVFIHKLTEILC